MAVPKRKVSKARRDKRRSQVWKLSAPAFSRCDNCGELKLAHRVCGNCGYYKGKEVIAHSEARVPKVFTQDHAAVPERHRCFSV